MCVTQTKHTMKRLLALLSVVTAFIAFAPTAEAYDSHSRVVGHTRCGRPIMSVYRICGYDRCGNPIGHWVTQSSSCACSTCRPRPTYNHHHHHQRPSCGTSYGSHYRPSFRSGGFYFSFGR